MAKTIGHGLLECDNGRIFLVILIFNQFYFLCFSLLSPWGKMKIFHTHKSNRTLAYVSQSLRVVSYAFKQLCILVSSFCLFRATPVAYGDSQVRGLIGAVAASLRQSHSNARSEPRL